jgi:DNA-directed RNA polymerase specialized sigma24 family protein
MDTFNPAPGTSSVRVSGQFTTTHWSVVIAASQQDSSESMAALEILCRTYWYPLYAYIRRRGYEPADAQDLTQEFFARLLSKQYLRAVDHRKGKFRSFLLAALEHFLCNEWRRSNTQKRGGHFTFISLDNERAEQQYLQTPVANHSPEQVFDQQWAITLLERALAKLQEQLVGAGKGALFDHLKIFLTGEKSSVSYAELVGKLKMTKAALKMSVSRMRHQYGEILRSEIASTVEGPEEIEEELHALFAALSS